MTVAAKVFLVGAALSLAATGVQAQQPLKFKPMNFDMWCQEHVRLPPSRCDKRLPEDDAAYQAYANKIENYEAQQQNQNAKDRRIDRAIQNSDPSSNPAGTPPTQPHAPQ